MYGRFPRRCLLMVAGLLQGGLTSRIPIGHHPRRTSAADRKPSSERVAAFYYALCIFWLLVALFGCNIWEPGSQCAAQSKKTGTRNLSGSENELEEYFAELEAGELDSAQVDEPKSDMSRLSDLEEARRLTAYVTHLQGKVAELPSPRPDQPRRFVSNEVIGLTVVVGIVAGVGLFARRLLRTA